MAWKSNKTNEEILDSILGDSQSRNTFGYWADLPGGGRMRIDNQADLDEFLRQCRDQGGASGYTSNSGSRYDDIEKYLRS